MLITLNTNEISQSTMTEKQNLIPEISSNSTSSSLLNIVDISNNPEADVIMTRVFLPQPSVPYIHQKRYC